VFYLAKKLSRPEIFQGNRRFGKPYRYFEGWYSFMRFMECYHGIIVMDADIEGKINGEPQSRGCFYLEKDWGTSFPKAWIWMQSNSFSTRASLSCSVARVPFRGKEFTGFIIGLFSGGKLHSFTTYNGSRLRDFR
jgi:hypothetical protein